MSAVIQQDLELLYHACLLGMALGVGYDGVRALRVLIRHSHLAVSIEDVLAWLGVGVVSFAFCLAFESGQLRGATLLCQLVGFLLYRLTVSRLLFWIATPILRLCHRILAVLIWPIGWIYGKICGKISIFVRKTLKNQKIFLKNAFLHLKNKA